MYNGGKIIIGLIIFLALASSPFWFSQASGKVDYLPDPVIVTRDIPGKDACVMPVDYMRESHMTLLDDWRQSVVRDGDRIHTAPDGKKYMRSLSNTCMSCHPNKTEFCDKCHDYMAVGQPDCWDCHIEPQEEI
jgi:hypothetical protein